MYITVKYFVFELPLVARDVYMATYFNDMGNQVSSAIDSRELLNKYVIYTVSSSARTK